MTLSIAELNNQYLCVFGLIDGLTKYLADRVTLNPNPTYINNASGTVKVLDATNTPQVIGPAGATTSALNYFASSNGDYNAPITSTFNPAAGRTYTAVVDLTAPGGFVGHWAIPLVVKDRTQ